MSRKELEELLKDNSTEMMYELHTSDLVNIKEFVNVSLQIDKKTLDYYYEIDVDELLNSNMPIDKYEILKSQGWALQEKKIVIYLKT